MAERVRIGSLSNLQSMGEHPSHDTPTRPEEAHGAPPFSLLSTVTAPTKPQSPCLKTLSASLAMVQALRPALYSLLT